MAIIGLWLLPLVASAQPFPSKPITMIVPFAAGGPADVVARALAASMGKTQTIVIENVGGAGGNIGVLRAAKARPDGYTLLFTGIGMAVSPALYAKLEYNSVTDFEPISLAVFTPLVVMSRKGLMSGTFGEFRQAIESGSLKVTIGNSGPGSASHLCAILLMSALRTNFILVPYRGTAPAMTDLIGGQLDMLCDAAGAAAPQLERGVVSAAGVTTLERSSLLPNVPTLQEQGVAGFKFLNFTALYAPKGTPQPIVSTLNDMVRQAIDDPAYRAALAKFGNVPPPRERATPADLATFLKNEIDRWGPIIKAANIRVE